VLQLDLIPHCLRPNIVIRVYAIDRGHGTTKVPLPVQQWFRELSSLPIQQLEIYNSTATDLTNLSQVLPFMTLLRSLVLVHGEDESYGTILNVLPDLTRFHVCETIISQENSTVLASWILNGSVTDLSLRETEGGSSILQALHKSVSLRRLNLAGSTVGVLYCSGLSHVPLVLDDVEGLCLALGNSSLQLLDISNNPMVGDAGIVCIAHVLPRTQLRFLNLSMTGTQEIGSQRLGQMLRFTSLVILLLARNDMSDDAMKLLRNHGCATLKELCFDENEATSAWSFAITRHLDE
jgi:hypothetical protein